MKIFKNRLTIGLLAIIFATLIIFVIKPFFIERINERIEIYEFSRDLEKGAKLKENDIKKVSIAKENDKDSLIKDKEEIIGKFVKKSVYADDFISLVKLSDKPIKGDDYLYDIPKGKRAMSVTITSFAKGLSAKLEKGDIVQIISATDEISETPNELRYVYLFSATSPSGVDKDELKNQSDLDDREKLPKTATLLVGEEQAKILALLESKESIHIALVYRGDKEEADKLLKEQDDFIKEENEKKRILAEEENSDTINETQVNNETNITLEENTEVNQNN